MISWLARQFRYCYGFLNTHDSPRQLAWGCAFGVLIGLLPKGNLLAVFFAVLFFTFRVNLSSGMLAALAISFIAGYVDPISHRIGNYLLSATPLQGTWTEFYNLPIVPWTRFNNTVVLGNLALGLILFYPVYSVTMPGFSWWKDFQQRRAARKQRLVDGASSALLVHWRRRQFAEFLEQVESLSRERRAA